MKKCEKKPTTILGMIWFDNILDRMLFGQVLKGRKLHVKMEFEICKVSWNSCVNLHIMFAH